MASSRRILPRISFLVIIVGCGAIVLSLGADFFGLSKPGFFGLKQIYFLLFGMGCLALGGILRLTFKQVKDFFIHSSKHYNRFSVIFLNTLIVFFFLEFAFSVPSIFKTMRMGTTEVPFQNLILEYLYPGDSRGPGTYQYAPYVIYRPAEFHGKITNINSQGERITPGTQCHEQSYLVYVFGGSTVFGAQVADNETIPFYLQEKLSKLLSKDVCVVNFGANGWVSTQGVIMLMYKIQQGQIPNLVIFYDGINDILTAESGHWFRGSLHQMFEQMEGSRHPFYNWIVSLNLYRGLERLIKKYPERKYWDQLTDEKFAKMVKSRYLENNRIVRAMSREYDFQQMFFWQPVHKDIRSRPRFHLVYSAIEAETKRNKEIYWLADQFSDEEDFVWTADRMHLKSMGNEMIAQDIINIFLEKKYLAGEKQKK